MGLFLIKGRGIMGRFLIKERGMSGFRGKKNGFLLPEKAIFVEPLVGFEPTTPRLQITCSGQLS